MQVYLVYVWLVAHLRLGVIKALFLDYFIGGIASENLRSMQARDVNFVLHEPLLSLIIARTIFTILKGKGRTPSHTSRGKSC